MMRTKHECYDTSSLPVASPCSLAGKLAGRLAGWLPAMWAGWRASWLAGWLADLLADWLANLMASMLDWLVVTHWLIGWLGRCAAGILFLVHWSIHSSLSKCRRHYAVFVFLPCSDFHPLPIPASLLAFCHTRSPSVLLSLFLGVFIHPLLPASSNHHPDHRGLMYTCPPPCFQAADLLSVFGGQQDNAGTARLSPPSEPTAGPHDECLSPDVEIESDPVLAFRRTLTDGHDIVRRFLIQQASHGHTLIILRMISFLLVFSSHFHRNVSTRCPKGGKDCALSNEGRHLKIPLI